MTNNSILPTVAHKRRVLELLAFAANELLRRGLTHDDSKLEHPEIELYDVFTPRLSETIYGSEEYKTMLGALQPALEHHYSHNTHHPEHYENGIEGMDLFDIVEMFFDWKAASERHNDGNIHHSIQVNRDRFRINNQLVCIFENTARRYLDKKESPGSRKTS